MTPRPPPLETLKQLPSLSAILRSQIPLYRKAAGYSLITSLLVLTPTVFMLEVYDRVINSRSVTTLISLLACVIALYVLMEVLEKLRSRLLQHAGWRVDSELRERLHDTAFTASLRYSTPTIQPFTDLRTLREFITSPAVTAMMDAPSSLIFLMIVSIISPWLGIVAFIGAIAQVLIGISTERKTMPVLTEANRAAIDAQNYANGMLRNAQVTAAMGMQSSIHKRWIARQHKFLNMQALASDTAGSNSASSKVIQTLQGSLLLGLSCWLSVKGMLLGGGGMMIVASTLGGRVLSPLVQLVTHWRLVVNARDAYQRLDNFLALTLPKIPRMPLPAPHGQLLVENLVATAPGSNQPIIKGVSFALQPGESLMIIGASAAGKTTLAKLLMGIWPATSGKVRLDGADLHDWDKDELGPHLGYLPQTIELFDGTVTENISRFGDVDMNQLRSATDRAGLTAMIDALPLGFETRIGDEGAILSGGQRQRVALARAIYGNPRFVLLDEPNSSLDTAGDKALVNTLIGLKASKCTTIFITHRTSLLPVADKILLLRDGQVAAFGPRDDVLASLRSQSVTNRVPGQLSRRSV